MLSSALRIVIERTAGVATVRAMFKHPMETGRRRDEHGKLVPENYIREVICEYAGRTILKADWSTGIAKNPALTLQLQGVQQGEKLSFRWLDNHGNQASAEALIS